MIQEIQLLEQLLEKYRLTEPVPEEVRAYFIKRKKKFFIKVCKSLGIYNIFLGAVLTVFFFSKKLGIALTVIQSAVVITAFTVLTTGTVTYCGYNVIKPLLCPETKHEKKPPSPVEPKQGIRYYIPKKLMAALPVAASSDKTTARQSPALLIEDGSLVQSGTNINIPSFLKALRKELGRIYTGSLLGSPQGNKSALGLSGTFINDGSTCELYIRLTDTGGINFSSLQYHSQNLQGLYRQIPQISKDIAEACNR